MRTTIEPAATDDHRRAAAAALEALGRTVGSLRCAGSQRLVRLGISMTHFHVLTLLRHHDAMPIGRIAEIIDASMSSATGIIDRMEERGLVERTRVPGDRRVVLVSPTERGLALVDEAELVKSEVMAAALSRLTADELDRLAVATTDLRRAIADEIDGPAAYAALVTCDHARVAHPAASDLPVPSTGVPAAPATGATGA